MEEKSKSPFIPAYIAMEIRNKRIVNKRVIPRHALELSSFRFSFSGIIALQRVNIYFKTYYLKNEKLKQDGVFSSIDNENRLVNGTLTIDFKESR